MRSQEQRAPLSYVVVVAGGHRPDARTQIWRGHLLHASNQAWPILIREGTNKTKQQELQQSRSKMGKGMYSWDVARSLLCCSIVLSPALRELAAAMADWWVLPSAAVWRRGEVK